MTNRSVSVTLRANVADFKRQIDSGAQSLEQLAKKADQSSTVAQTGMGRLVQSADLQRESWDLAGATMVGFGTATVAGLGASAAAAVNWESQWAGVTKTVDGTETQLAGLETGLRGMARELPAAHGEIAAVAEAAGALGVKTEDVQGFTQTMIALGETTNLTADEAATNIAQISNVMGTLDREGSAGVERFGATLVQLGNNGASTEAEILNMAQRISSTASVIGMSEADVLGYANALASVGINAEAGGTAISRVFMDIASAVSQGGDDLTAFSDVAGMSAQDFAAAFEEDPARAVATFIEGLGGISAAGGDVFGVLSELGMSDIRVSQALLTMAESGDLLTESLDMGAAAWQSNTALQDEFGKRLETTAAQLDIAKNNIVDAGISLGETFLPAIVGASEAVSDFFGWISDLPDPLQNTFVTLGSVAGVASLAAGGFLLLFPRVIDTVKAFRDLRTMAPGLATGLGRVTRAAGATAAALATLTIIDGVLTSMSEGAASVDETTAALLGLDTAAGDIDAMFSNLGSNINFRKIDGLQGAIERLTSPSIMDRLNDFGGEIWSLGDREGSVERDAIVKQFDAIGQSLASMVQSGHAEEARAQFETLREAWEAGGGDIEDLRELVPGYVDALAAMKAEQVLTADATAATTAATGEFSGQVGQSAEELEAASEAFEKWFDMMLEAGGSFGGVTDAYQAVIDKTREWAEEQAAATETADDSWDDFYNGQDVSMADWIAQLKEQGEALANWGENAVAAARLVREEMPRELQAAGEQMVNDLLAAGAEGAPMLQAFIDAAPEQRRELIEAYTGTGDAVAAEVAADVDAAFNEQPVHLGIEADTEPALNDLARFGQQVDEETYGTHISANTEQALIDLGGYLVEVDNATGTVSINGNRVPADSTLGELLGNVNESDGTVTLLGNRVPADMTLDDLIAAINGSRGVADIAGNDAQAQRELSSLLHTIRSSSAAVNITANTGTAQSQLDQFVARNNGRSVTTYQRTVQMGQGEFWSGGYTGDGGKFEPAGVVHRGEWVTTKERTAEYRPILEAIHAGTFPRLPGLANGTGSLVAPRAYQPAWTGSTPPPVQIYLNAVPMDVANETGKTLVHALHAAGLTSGFGGGIDL
ncbi:phage tail tape measure protein, TP901 family, core region [Georgenia satyanarayanai]|uniref:Phage tail tape measure protein, TP901 family, core region n=1 Tax=Georgenia satyanarayanai TaxID=860221 RepID=A0A2Y9A7F8_9MICO|nr:phage tail tape measure protein [Georgenia satyanarayanai]PYG00157.1 TP901 family phage tail tape measure protein [Georgenia satyanarayanai]SSA40374.1 phage tail tape measure protein, TP901 family, core region [Georgenia satyanarayanai]